MVDETLEVGATIATETVCEPKDLADTMRRVQSLKEIHVEIFKEKPDCGRIVAAKSRLQRLLLAS